MGWEMRATTLFSDQVVNASELRSNQKYWLEEALRRPITVSYNRKSLAIVNRDQVRDLYIRLHYAELLLTACRDISKGRIFDEFPWLEYLNTKEREQFVEELLSCFNQSTKNGNWDQMDNLIADWKATAEAEHSPVVISALKDNSAEYVAIDE